MDIRGERSKTTVSKPSGPGVRLRSGMFESAVYPSGTTAVMAKVAFMRGSSRQGKARLASVASNWEVAITRGRPSASFPVHR
ncbi:MAG: hypothetical protein M1313_08030 [Nitrospirae bacterium]|nr:hypothetical protein [Nitrospirota bacterium]